MSDPLTKAQRAFIPIQEKGDLPAAVTLARSVVTGALLSGNFDDDVNGLAASLAGQVEPEPKHDDVVWSVFCEQLMAALAMGIAIGQLVHPDVFKTGRAR